MSRGSTEGGRSLRARVARRLRGGREEIGLSQSELARRAGVSRSYYAAIEAGRRNMSLDVLERLATALGSRPEALVAPEDPIERVDDPKAARFARLLQRLDEPTRRTVLEVMERFASYGSGGPAD